VIFVGGTGRSGTTVLAQAFAKDPDLAVFIEPRFMIGDGGLLEYAVSQRIDRAMFVENFIRDFLPKMNRNLRRFGTLDSPQRLYSSNSIRLLDSGIRAHQRYDYARLFTVRLTSMACGVLRAKDAVIKDPHSILWASYIQLIFEQSYFIHIIRDPRDVCASVVKRKWGPKSAVEFSGWYSRIMAGAYTQYEHCQHKSRYAVVQLEELAREPLAVMDKLYGRFFGSSYPAESIGQLLALVNPGKAHIGRHRAAGYGYGMLEQVGETYQRWQALTI